MKQEVAIGIDIGGTSTKYGIVSTEGRLFFEGSIVTTGYSDPKDFVVALQREIDQKLKEYEGEFDVKGIGIGAPNGNYYTGNIEYAPNLEWKGVVELSRIMEEVFGLKAVVTNDANAAALGEMLFGDAKGMKNFVMVTLGTGLGSGIVVNGDLVYGHDGFAGELGHVCVKEGGRQCGCGKRGCMEAYVSATGISRSIYKLLADETVDSSFRGITFQELDAKDITKAAENGDPIAIKAFEKTGSILGHKLADTVAHLSPEAIFLFGGLARAGKWIFDPTRKAMEANLLPIFRNKIKLHPSALLDKNIAVLGAAALLFKNLDS